MRVNERLILTRLEALPLRKVTVSVCILCQSSCSSSDAHVQVILHAIPPDNLREVSRFLAIQNPPAVVVISQYLGMLVMIDAWWPPVALASPKASRSYSEGQGSMQT